MSNSFKFTNDSLRAHVKAALIKDSKPQRYTPQTFTNADIEGVTAHLSKRGKVTFYLRARIDRRREHENLGPWSETAFSPKKLEEVVEKQLAIWHTTTTAARQTRNENIPTLDTWIDMYPQERIDGNVEGCRKGKKNKPPGNWKKIAQLLRAVYKPLLSTPLDRLTRKDTKACEGAYLKARLAPGSVQVALAYLLLILRHGIAQGHVVAAEFITVKVEANGKRRRFLLPGEWQLITPALDKLPKHRGLFIRFLVYMGVRKSMAASMKWEDVRPQTFYLPDGSERQLLVWTVVNNALLNGAGEEDEEDEETSGLKCAESSTLPIVGAALRIYEQLCALCPDEGDNRKRQPTVFPQSISRPWTSNGVSNKQRGIQVQVDRLSGTHGWHRHDCRRTHATYKRYLGLSKGEIARGLSHADGERHMNYAGAVENYLVADPFLMLVEGYERVGELFDDMEHGRLSLALKSIQSRIGAAPATGPMMKSFKLDPELAKIKERMVPQRPALVA